MMTDERLDNLVDGACGDSQCWLDRNELGDEIKRLRSDNDQLKAMLDMTRAVIADYQTPNVDKVTIKEIEK